MAPGGRPPWRILFVSFNMPWQGGGTFYRVIGFARHLARRGHQVTVVATSPDERWRVTRQTLDGVELLLTPALPAGKLRTGWDPYEVVRRMALLRRRTFDIVHGFESRPVVIYPALFASRRATTSLFLDWCDWFGRGGSVEARPPLQRALLRPVETFFEEHFRTRAAGTTTINSVLRRRAEQLGVPAERIHWLPNGSELEKIRPLDRAQARAQLGLDPEAIYIGHLGQAFPEDAALLAAAFRAVHAHRPDARLLLIGNHKTDIAAYVGARSAIIETGFVDDEALNHYLGACDLLWLPLRDTLANRGRWPMKLSDYLSSGRPTVSTPVGDLTALFSGEHPVGRLAADDAQDFAQQTLGLLADEALCAQLGANARAQVVARFSWEQVTAELEAFYGRIMNQSGAPDG